MTEPEVVFSQDGQLGRILLNRPQAMNALTFGMVTSIAAQLDEWATDPSIATVLIHGAGERGLCAGGDIVELYREIQAGGDGAATFWSHEYTLNLAISNYPKPYVALMDGVVLGGGVGMSAHGSVRVVTERTKVGMPEVGIGFGPDVGGTWLLAQAPGELGTHAGLTGGVFGGADALELGMADYFVASDRLDELIAALAAETPADALAGLSTDAGPSALAAARAWIDECYSSDDASEIMSRLQSSSNADARAAAEVIRSKSPTSVAATLASLRRARAASGLAEALDQEFVVSLHFAASPDMAEGIRAQVIDKDRTPHWSPATLAGVERSSVEAYFEPQEHGELGLSRGARPAQSRTEESNS